MAPEPLNQSIEMQITGGVILIGGVRAAGRRSRELARCIAPSVARRATARPVSAAAAAAVSRQQQSAAQEAPRWRP
jgi:hypothetical protein